MHKILALFMIITLCACHVGEEYQTQNFVSPQEVKETLKLTTNTQNIDIDWYKIFNDEDLNTLISCALNNNFSVKQGIEKLKQSRISLAIQSKELFPMIDAVGGYDFSKSNNNQNFLDNTNYFKFGFDMSWELDIWGKGKYITEQYSSLMHNQAYNLLNINVSITAEVVNNFIYLREAQEKLNIAQRNLSLQRDIYKVVKDKYHAGIADDLALNQAEYTVETTKSTIPVLKQQIEQYKNAIAVLLGVLPQNLPVNLDNYKKNITAHTFNYKTQKLYDLPLSVIRLRPDIMASEAIIKAQNASVQEAITQLYPSINLSATFGFVSTSGHSLFDKDSQIYGYNPVVNIPIWHWKQLKNNVDLQKSIKEEYILNYNEAMLSAITELKNAIVSIEQAYKTNAFNKSSLNKMYNIMDLTKQKYKNGLIEFTDVAEAEKNYLQAQNTLASSNAQILIYLTSFYKAVGGGYNLQDTLLCNTH